MDREDDHDGTLQLASSVQSLSLDPSSSPSFPAAAATATDDDPLSPATHFATPSDLCFELDSLQDLAARGQWRAVLDKVTRARSLSLLSARPPHHKLVYLAFSLLALFKLRRFRDADRELHSLDHDLDSPRYRYESYPDAYPGRSGSMLPFAVRYLHAELPLRLGSDRADTLDRLYGLLDLVRSRIREKEGDGVGAGARPDLWRRREAFLVASICRHHFAHQEFDVCLLLIRELLAMDPSDPVLLSSLAYVQMQIGDLEGCRATFARVEGLCGQRSGVEFENLVGRNRALGFVVAKDYQAAVREYEACIERDPADVVAINNKALCLMYSRDLSDSIKVLEGALERVPTAAVNEMVVVNLCSMYELAYVNHGDIKGSLSNWIARVAPDDFDSSCTRI
uniref:Trafficking protein particle complex subunit 12 n=1 Tax=Anthurium amnicola TaxID=1678845 RepID=A0A1D1XJ70_9ARAE